MLLFKLVLLINHKKLHHSKLALG